ARRLAQWLNVERADMVAPLDLPPQQPRALEHPQMLGDGIQGDGKVLSDFGNSRGTVSQALDNRPPSRVGDGAEDVRQSRRLSFTHLGEDIMPASRSPSHVADQLTDNAEASRPSRRAVAPSALAKEGAKYSSPIRSQRGGQIGLGRRVFADGQCVSATSIGPR